MATRIKLKRSTTAAAVPTTSNLEDGEVALNITDKKLYARNGSNIIEVANQKPNTGEVTTTMLSTDITNGQGNTFYVSTTGSDVTTLPNGGNAGLHPDTSFLTITKALTTATSGDTIVVAPGEYQEAFPMTIPDGVTLRGTNLRSTQVKPTGATSSNTAFILSGDSHISDLTIKDFFYDSGNDDGYAFEVVSSMNSTQSPYIERVTVNTKGSVVSGSDPYGYAQGDAGRGAKLDGANLNAASLHSSVLFNECTFITPNQVGVKITNGMRVEWLNCFNYFASIGIQGIQGAAGRAGAGQLRLKLGGVSGTVSAGEILYQLEDSFQSGTYSRTGDIVTVTRTGHGLVTGEFIYADHISGAGVDAFEPITVVDANTFTYDNGNNGGSGTTSGNITYKKAVARVIIISNDGTYLYSIGGNKGIGEFTTVNKSPKTLSRFGDSQLSTAQKKFGTASILLDGTEDNVKVPTDEDFGFGTANWCLEAFIRPGSVSGIQRIFDLRDNSATDTAPTMYLNGTTLHYAVGNTSQISGGTLATGTFYHVAVARNNGTTKLFLDGTELGTYTDSNDYGTTKPVIIGSDYQAGPTQAFNGHVDEVRISKASARFTAGFTPTTTEYSSDINTVLLLHANGTDASTTFTDVSGGTSDIRTDGGDSATSVITSDYSAFGAEMRSVASACVYGQKGVQADGSGVKLIMTAHNFGYVGSGQDFTNDPSLAVQNNEVEELNGGKVLYSSTDQDGDFRVGDAFTVDQETGNVAFAATSTAQSAANITLSDATGTTNIFPAYIETGNLRLAGNSITSTTGQVIVDPSGEEDFVVNAETIVKDAIYFDVNKSISFGSSVQGSLKIGGFGDSTVFGSSEASSFSTRSFTILKNGIGTVNITGAGTGYTGGAQPTTVITDPFQKATVTNTLATNGSVKRINITNRGEGYTQIPTVAFSAGAATGDAILANGGRIEETNILDGGTGYTSATISVDIEAPSITAFTAGSSVVDTTLNTITLTLHPFETGDLITYDATTTDPTATAIGGLTTATNYYAIRVDDNTIKIALNATNANNGTEIPLTSAGDGSQFFQGQQAVLGTPTISAGVITALPVTTKGTGYANAPSITITDSGSGSGANINATLGRSISSVALTAFGSYPSGSAPTLTFTNDAQDTTGQNAAGDAILGFALGSVTLATQGLGYRNLPTIVISGNPSTAAQLTITLDEATGRIGTLTMETGSEGDGYETNPTITLEGGGGTGAILNVDVQSLTGSITATGSGYTPGTYDNVGWTGSAAGTGGTATFTIPGLQGAITAAGSGYADGTYSNVEFRNPATTTYTITVVQRDKLNLSSVTGTFAVGNTVTSSSGGTGTVTVVTATYLYISGASGAFDLSDTLTNGSGASATVDSYTSGVNRYLINGVEGQSLTLIDDNTYRFDTSDVTNGGHPLALGVSLAGLLGRTEGTEGSAGSYFEIVVAPGVAALGSTSYLNCLSHGQEMIEPGELSFATGSAGQSGSAMLSTITIVGGQVTGVEITAQGLNAKVGDVLIIDAADVGGSGSGFQYTINSNNTGITSVTNISLTGTDYAIAEVLSVDDTNVGGGGGSGFQYTVSNVGFVSAVSVTEPGQAYELSDTLILGDVGGTGIAQGTGFTLTLATLDQIKALELTQSGELNMGVGGGSQVNIRPDGTFIASNWSISATGSANLAAVSTSGSITATGTFTASSTSSFLGMASFNGGVTIGGADSTIDRANIKILDGSATQPSFTFSDSLSNTTGLFKQASNKIGVTFSGTEGVRLDGTNYIDTKGLQIDAALGSNNPFLKVETTTPKLSIGATATQIEINDATTISTAGTDIDVPLTFDTKGGGDYTFKGGANVDFIIDDGTTEVFKLETSTGTALFSGNLDAGKLRVRQNVIQNNSTAATRSFGEVLALTVTGTGSGYTDGTYTATATTSTGGGTGLTVDVTVASGTFSSVVVYDKGQNYKIGDQIVITAVGGGTGLSITVTDIDGQGIVLKPSSGKDVLVDTTGSLVIPSGTTNERPNTLDRVTGAIRFNSTQLQFEGFNGNDFVSLGGVRDVDQDTYILTESNPGADEDTFEFYAAGVNNISLNNTTLTFRPNMTGTKYDSDHTATIDGGYILNGTTFGTNPYQVSNLGSSVFTVRSKNDIEVNGGLRLRNVPSQGVASSIDAATITQTATAYTASTTFTGIATTAQIEGNGLTVDVVTDSNGTITSIAINSGGTGYENGETIQISGTALGGLAPANNVTFKLDGITGGSAAITRLDVLQQEYITQLDAKPFVNLDATGAEAGWKVNRGWSGGTINYLTVFDSTATFMELDDCRVEGGQLASFPSSASIVAFDKSQFKGSKTLVTIESDDGKVHMLEVTVVCAAAGTTAHATVTNSVTSDNNLVDATVSVVGSNVTISLNKSSAATSSSNFTGRFTTTKVKV